MQTPQPGIVRVRAPCEPAVLLQLRQQASDLRLVGVAVFDQFTLRKARLRTDVHQDPHGIERELGMGLVQRLTHVGAEQILHLVQRSEKGDGQ